jgi:periplasmic protein TonB
MSKKDFIAINRTPLAILSMLGGGLLMVILVISFNKGEIEKDKKIKKEKRAIELVKHKKRAVKPKPKPKQKPKKTTPKAPLPNLNSMMDGVVMNIPEFSTGDFAGDTKDILGDIAEDAIMNENTVDSKPKVQSRTPMEYPESAAKDGIKGYVILNLLIGKDGSVEIAKILESQPEGVFDNAAVNGVKSWRFSPAKYKGKSVKIWAKQKVSFN